jgi:hypothetical protein
MEQCGFKALLVDAAEISATSLQFHFSGHVVVAVRNQAVARWILCDPTNGILISGDWSPTDKIFWERYWIGFAGPLSMYPAHDPASLMSFYDSTLKGIPRDVLNRRLPRFRFTVDASLVAANGEYLHPNLRAFVDRYERFLRDAHIEPQTEIPIVFVKGNDSAESNVRYSKSTGWVCNLGLKSALSPAFLSYIETMVIRQPFAFINSIRALPQF